jgi:general stress protein 26
MTVNRTPEQRKSDALAMLTASNTNIWVASASLTGAVHLVPVSHTWNGAQIIVATEPSSRTAANVAANPQASLALGETRDVVMIEAILVKTFLEDAAPAELADGYATQARWDPRTDSDDYIYLVFRPERIGVWREGEDLTGRTVMRSGAWVI